MANRPYTSDAWAAMTVREREANLRARATPSELQLKSMLDLDPRTRNKFKFQAHCCGYYVDFLCAKQKLVVELDGAVHSSPAAKIADARRTRKLTLKGYRVLRFWNGELRQPTAVLCRILNALEFDGPMQVPVQFQGQAEAQSLSLDALIISTRAGTRRRAGASV